MFVRVRPRSTPASVRDGPLDEHLLQRAEQLLVAGVRVTLDDLDEPLEALALDVLGDLVVHARRVRARAAASR